MDTISYEKQDDGTIIKTVFHQEESRVLDEKIGGIKKTIPLLEEQARLAQQNVVDAYNALEEAQAENEKQLVPDVVTLTHKEEVTDVKIEIEAIQATIENLKAGATDTPEEKQVIDDSIKNYEAQLEFLK